MLTPINVPKPEDFTVTLLREEDIPSLLVVRASGKYPIGSKGSLEAHCLRLKTAEGVFGYHPLIVIYDFSELEYRWGNGLMYSLRILDIYANSDDEVFRQGFQFLIVVGENSRAGIESLLGSRVKLFGSLEPAIKFADEKIHEWLESP